MTAARVGNGEAMTDRTGHAAVAGVDGSDDSLAAALLAADEATLRQIPLELVHAFTPPLLYRPAGVPPDLPPVAPASELPDDQLRTHAEHLLHEVATRVRTAHPGLPVITRLRDGSPAGVLADASRQATVVVIGHRGAGGFSGLLAGSVGIQLASHAACPVVVARGEVAPGAPVVVGVDGSDGSRRAARFALDAAARYQVPLVALYAWPVDTAWPPELVQAGYPPPQAEDLAGETVRDLAGECPQVTVRPVVRKQVAAHEALVTASEEARLVVVGSRGRGGFKGLLLGSVSQALIHHALCPVAVVGPQVG
jgi:nucleotide-binding universal stress UspA family protein